MSYFEDAKKIEDYIIAIRRELHEHPELSCQEFETQKRIIRELESMGIEYRKVGTTSVVGTIKGDKPGKTVALRADFDALPIIEHVDVPYKSKNEGVMHACGHDGHTAMLLGAAKILSSMKSEIKGEVRLLFQEGEETFAGARKVIADGGMDGVDAVFGMHGMPIEMGKYDINPGYKMAGCDTIYVKFEGVSGHGSSPHLAKDTIHPACIFVTEMQTIVGKGKDPQKPLVLSVGKFDGGTKANIISKYTKLDISMRYFDEDVRKIAHEKIKKYAKAIEIAYDIKVDVEIETSAVSLYNNEEITKIAQAAAEKVYGPGNNIDTGKLMGSEDMPFYFQHAKGVYGQMGYLNVEKDTVYFPHHEKFNIDEDYLKYGAALHVQFSMDFLNQ